MNKQFRLSVLQKHSPQSHDYVGRLQPSVDNDALSTETVESLAEAVRVHLKTLPRFKSCQGDDVDRIDFKIYQNPQKLNRQGLVEKANSDQLNEDHILAPSTALKTLGETPELVFVFESLSFRFVLFRTTGSSIECLAVKRATALLTQNVDVIKQVAWEYVRVKFGPGFQAEVDVLEPQEPFQLRDRLNSKSMKDLCSLLNEDFRCQCYIIGDDLPLEQIVHREYLIVTVTPRFGFVLFERDSPLYRCIGSWEVTEQTEDPIQFIERAAGRHAKGLLSGGADPEVEIFVGDVSVYKPTSSYLEAYDKTLKQMESLTIDHTKLARAEGLAIILAAGDPLNKLLGANFIVECVIKRRRKLRFTYALFERNCEVFKFVGRGSVDASSDQTMRVIWDAVRGYIELLPKHCTETGHHIEVYEPTKSFKEAYGKTAMELTNLDFGEHLEADPVECVALVPQEGLSDVNASQTLIAVFSIPSRSVSTLSDMFLRLKIVKDPPSMVSQPVNYKSIQNQSDQRILDDRPFKDEFLPPISLLYQGFGIFEDVRRGISVPGDEQIREAELWNKVDAFAKQMSEFYDSEAARRAVVIRNLQDIFRVREDPDAAGEGINASWIGSRQIISDGHMDGARQAMVFCLECKNELSNISCEPSAELVSHVASSLKEQLVGNPLHNGLFHAWRAPALGMTQIGPFVQFLGIVMVKQMRVVHLTPMLPLTIPVDDEQSRRDVFLAFKAASIVIAMLRADARRLLRETNELPVIPLESRALPSITEIRSPSLPPITFTLLRRYDEKVSHRNLYHARVDPTDMEIYVKFTRQYSIELHSFCAAKGLAPKLLGFERLIGGWIVLAMQKVDIVEPWEMKSFSDVGTWKQEILALVQAFHEEDLVHGDLRLRNFIFTKESPHRILLVDFDWGGKAGKTFFPPGRLNEELQVQDGRLDRPITKEHDRKVLKGTFELLEQVAARAEVGQYY